jgi:hypothetical protein
MAQARPESWEVSGPFRVEMLIPLRSPRPAKRNSERTPIDGRNPSDEMAGIAWRCQGIDEALLRGSVGNNPTDRGKMRGRPQTCFTAP